MSRLTFRGTHCLTPPAKTMTRQDRISAMLAIVRERRFRQSPYAVVIGADAFCIHRRIHPEVERIEEYCFVPLSRDADIPSELIRVRLDASGQPYNIYHTLPTALPRFDHHEAMAWEQAGWDR